MALCLYTAAIVVRGHGGTYDNGDGRGDEGGGLVSDKEKGRSILFSERSACD